MKIKNLKLAGIAVYLATAVTAHAQSSVTLYGVTDVGLEFSSKAASASGNNAGKAFAVTDSGEGPSSFGLRGVEDLGSGLKAEFTLESGINMANGGFNSSNGNLFGRQAWVGIDGDFGEVKAGLQFSPFFIALFESDPREFSELGSGLVLYANNVAVTGGFNSNAVSYTSPKLAGFQGSVMLAVGGDAGNFAAGRQWSASAKYEKGSVMFNASIYDGNGGGTVQTPVPSTMAFEGRTLGAAYTFGPLQVKGSFVNYKVAGSFNANVFGGGIGYMVSPAVLLNAGAWYTSDRDDTSNHSLMTAMGADYLLSKRTSLYGQVGFVNNHGAMNTSLSISDSSLMSAVQGMTVGANVGIRQTF